MTEADLRRILSPADRTLLVLAARGEEPELIAKLLKVPVGELDGRLAALRERLGRAAGRRKAGGSGANGYRPSRPAGKSVTFSANVTPREEESMPVEPQSPVAAEGFAERIQRETQEEVAAVLADLARVRFRADQVVRVLRALGLPVPEELSALTSGPERTEEVVPEPKAAAQPESGPAQPEPGKEPEPEEKAPEPAARPEMRRERSAPTHPGADAVPENLRHLPAAGRGGPLRQRIAAAEAQYQILSVVKERATSIPGEVAAATGLPAARVADHLRDLYRAGLIRRTGRNRRAAGVNTGRASVEYAPLTEEKPAAPEPATSPRLEAVRDAVRGRTEPFSPRQLAEEQAWDPAEVEQRLQQLAQMGVVSDEGVADGPRLFAYVKPTEAGRAAELDRQGRLAETPGRTNGSAPVANVNLDWVGNSEMKKLVKECVKAGCRAQKASNGHIAIQTPSGKRVLIASTPGNNRTVLNERARLRRAGVNI